MYQINYKKNGEKNLWEKKGIGNDARKSGRKGGY